MIPWETIAEIRPVTILGLPFLKLIFQGGRPPVLINCMALPLTAKRLVEEIATFRKAL
ncbi:hypothetical protein [Armatimonas rosea]|uniref:Uncharacterized protein n=1 Tax=Armatimonas rosea TaxID=685828 RepID=A0A7W9SSU8_ARMRO|nr:hypothetical protein [Armatimonas rosea]MBB6051344.1 hypothetical protein [Armatimonas rosea]